MDNTTIHFNTTTLVLYSNESYVEFVTIIGNVSYTEGLISRLLANNDNSNVTFSAVPMLRVGANPVTGAILTVEKTSGTDDLSAGFGINVAREILVNQDIAAYGDINAKRVSDDPDATCMFEESVHGEVFCPEFSAQSEGQSTKYRRVYSTDSAKSRRLSVDENFSMHIDIETIVDRQTGLVKQANSVGSVSLAVFKTSNGTSMVTLNHNFSTVFDVQPNSATLQDLGYLRSVIDASNFTVFNSTPNSVLNTTGSSRILTERELTGPLTSSKSVKLFTLFGVNVNALTVMTISTDSMRVLLILDFAGILQYDLADETFGGPVVQGIWKVLGLRDFVKGKLETLLNTVKEYVNKIKNDIQGSVFGKVNEIKAQIETIKQSYMATIQQLQDQLNGYKAKVKGIADNAKSKFEQSMLDGKQRLESIKTDMQSSIAGYQAKLQPHLDAYTQQFEDAKGKAAQMASELNDLRSTVLNTDQLKRIADSTGIVDSYMTQKAQFEDKLAAAQAQIAAYVDGETAKAEMIVSEASAIVERQVADVQNQADILVQKFGDTFDEAVGAYDALRSSALATITQIESDIQQAKMMVDSSEKVAQLANLTDYWNLYSQKKAEIEANMTQIQSQIDQYASQKQADANAIITAAQSLAQQNITALRQAASQKIDQYRVSLQPTIEMYQSTISNAVSKAAAAKTTIESIKNEVLKTPQEIARMANLTSYAKTYESTRSDFESSLTSVLTTIASFAKDKRVTLDIAVSDVQSSVLQTITEFEQQTNDDIQAYKDTFADSLANLASTLGTITSTIATIQADINAANLLAQSPEKIAKLSNLTSTLAAYQSKSNEVKASIASIQADILAFETTQKDNLDAILAPMRQELADTIANEQSAVEQEIADFKSAKQGIVDDFTSLLSTAKSKASEVTSGILELRDSLCSPDTLTKIVNATSFLSLYESKKEEAQKLATSVTDDVNNFIEQKQASVKAIIASVQSTIDETKAKLGAIVDGSFSWQDEFERAGLTLIDDILEPFKQAKASFETAISQIVTLANSLKSAVTGSVQGFKGGLSASSSDVSSGFSNIAGQSSTAAKGDANVFDFSFFDTLFTSVKDTLKSVSSTVNGVKDLLDGSVLLVVKDAMNILNPEQWLTIFADVKMEIADLQAKYKYLKSAPDVGEQWLKDTIGELKTIAMDQLKKVNIADMAMSLAPTLTNSLLSGIVDIGKIKDKLISDFLGKVLIPPKKYSLFKYGPYSTPMGPPIPTPIGAIIISWSYAANSDLYVSITLDSNQLVASVNPTLAASFAVSAAWKIVIAEVGAMAGASVSGEAPFSVGMKRQTRGIFINGDLSYHANGNFGLYYKYLYPVFRARCWTIKIGRVRINICIFWFDFLWTAPKVFFGATIGASGNLILLRKSF